MAFSIGQNAVIQTTGRGAAKVSLSISFAKLEAWAKRQKLDTKRLMDRSFGRAAAGLKKKFYQVMKNAGGLYGVPKFNDFEEFTKTLRANTSRASRPMGGLLADKGFIVAYKQNGWQIIGWPDYLEQAARKFQEGIGGPAAEKYFTDPQYRRLWHIQGLKEIPRAYVHNERRVIPEPFGTYVQQNLENWAKGAFYKELARQMTKGSKAA